MTAILEDLEIESGVLAMQAPRVRHLKRFQPGPYPGRITLFANAEWYAQSPTLGWTLGHAQWIEVRPLPGQHGSFQRDHTVELAAMIRELLVTIDAEIDGAP